MFIRNKLRKFYYNSRYVDQIGHQLPDGTLIKYGRFAFDNYTLYANNDISITVAVDDDPFIDIFNITILIDHIVVYQDGWIHNVPKEMKEFVYNHIKKLNDFNKQCKQDNVYKTYKQQLKKAEQEKKLAKKQKFKKERQILIDKFK